MIMDFTLVPNLTAFVVGFVILALVAVAAVAALGVAFLVSNRAVRVRRHEGILSYYGHLALGH
jgi:hypothetical protein